MTQLTFKLKNGEYSDDFSEEASYQSALATLQYCHRFIGWIWTGSGIKYRTATKEDVEGDCHYTLFGEQIYTAPFRGWFNPEKKVLTFMDKAREIRNPDMIPERVYQHLTRKFGKDLRFVIP